MPKVCALCKESNDTVHHRAWLCKASKSIREAIATPALIREAQLAGEEDVMFSKAIGVHPATGVEGPAFEGGVTVTSVAGCRLKDLELSDDIYIDGSCTTHPVVGFRRAAFGIVMLSASGEVLATVSGPVWSSLPQTPQAGEHVALAALTELLGGPATAYSDCQSVVRQASLRLKDKLDGRRPYAGVHKAILKHASSSFLQGVVKVKAHVVDPGQEHTIEDEQLRRHALGNNLADAAAKAGLRAHPGMGPEVANAAAAYFAKMTSIARVLACTGKLWPSSRQHNGALSKRDVPEGGEPVAPRAKASAVAAVLPADSLGHVVRCYSDGTQRVVRICLRCAGWSQFRSVKLAKLCRGRPRGGTLEAAAARRALRRVVAGLHPCKGVVIVALAGHVFV